MSMPYSVEEIDAGMLAEGYDMLAERYDRLSGLDKAIADSRIADAAWRKKQNERNKRLADEGYGLWLDNCGDGPWYCEHCLQEECGKRMAKCPYVKE